MKIFRLCYCQYDSIFGWRKTGPWSAPAKLVMVRVCNEHYRALKIRSTDPRFNTRRDPIGAQVVIARMNLEKSLNMRRCYLVQVSLQIKASKNSCITVIGGLIVDISTNDRVAKTIFFVVSNCDRLTLCREMCENLGLLTHAFPVGPKEPENGQKGTAREQRKRRAK